MKHDYKAALEEFENGDGFTSVETNETIRHALAMMQKLEEPSDGMLDAGDEAFEVERSKQQSSSLRLFGKEAYASGGFLLSIFKAMLEQAEKEIEG